MWPSIDSYNQSRRSFLVIFLLTLSVLSSIFVLVEPAPTDILVIGAVLLAAVLNKWQMSNGLLIGLILLGVFLGSNLLSLLFSVHLASSWYYFLITVYLLLGWCGLVGIAMHLEVPLVKWLMHCYVVCGVAISILGIAAYFGYLNSPVLFYGDRVKLFFQDPNVYGPFLVPAALFMIVAFSEKKRLVLGFASVIIVLAIVVSFSRGAWLNLAVSLFVVMLCLNGRQRLPLLALIVLVGSSFFLLLQMNEGLQLQFTARLGLQGYDVGRFQTQGAAWTVGMISPFGIGPGAADQLLTLSPHNVYARIFVENGWLGFISWLMFCAASLGVCFRSWLVTRSALYLVIFAALLGQFVNGYFIDILHWRHVWLLLAFAWIPVRRTT